MELQRYAEGRYRVLPGASHAEAAERFIRERVFLRSEGTCRLPSHNLHRRVWSLRLPGTDADVVVKEQWINPAAPWPRRVSQALLWRIKDQCRRAFDCALAMRAAGLETIDPMAYWTYRPPGARREHRYLMYVRIPAAESVRAVRERILGEATRKRALRCEPAEGFARGNGAGDARRLDALIDAQADYLRRMHAAGLRHRDVCSGNWLYEWGGESPGGESRLRLWLIDTDSVSVARVNWLPWKRAMDLRSLRRLDLTRAERTRFLKRYLGDAYSPLWRFVTELWWHGPVSYLTRRRTAAALALAAVAMTACTMTAAPGAAAARGGGVVELPRAPFADAEVMGVVTNRAVREASGLAASRRYDDVLWLLNDSGNPPVLYAVTAGGVSLCDVRVAGVGNRDWEDLASFERDGVPYLLIADTGDNDGRRTDCALHIVEEPDVRAAGGAPAAAASVAWTIRFAYEDGPRDCEAVAVDPAAGQALLLSKRTLPPVLYALDLQPPPPGSPLPAIARRLCAVGTIPLPTALDLAAPGGRYRSQPTAMDTAPGGGALAVLTYTHAYWFVRRPGQSWIDALARPPLPVRLPPPEEELLRGREALCFSRDGADLIVTREGWRPPLCRVRGTGGQGAVISDQ